MRLLVIIFFLLCAGKIFSQDTLTYSSFNDAQYNAWKQTEEKWLNEKYYPFLNKEKIKLSCAHCTSAFVWVAFKKDGSNTSYTIIRSKNCGGEFTGKQLADLKLLLDQIKLPEEFNNTLMKVMLGISLKC